MQHDISCRAKHCVYSVQLWFYCFDFICDCLLIRQMLTQLHIQLLLLLLWAAVAGRCCRQTETRCLRNILVENECEENSYLHINGNGIWKRNWFRALRSHHTEDRSTKTIDFGLADSTHNQSVSQLPVYQTKCDCILVSHHFVCVSPPAELDFCYFVSETNMRILFSSLIRLENFVCFHFHFVCLRLTLTKYYTHEPLSWRMYHAKHRP